MEKVKFKKFDHNQYICCLCPISRQIMQDPVVAEDGFSYERLQIERWLRKNQRSPITNQPLTSTKLIPNQGLRSMIESFKQQNLLDHKENLEIAKGMLLKLQTLLCYFTIYNELSQECKELLGINNIQDVWDNSSDIDKLSLLNQNQLQKYSYQFLKLEFRKYFEEITKYGREGLTCEDFWKKNENLQKIWLEEAYSKEFSNELTLLQKALIEGSEINVIEGTLKNLKIQTECFLSYDLLKENLQKQLNEIMQVQINKEWDNKKDKEKSIFLQTKNVKSFYYLKENFRQYLSYITQKERLAIGSIYPSIEDYWNSSDVNLKNNWINEFYETKFKQKLSVIEKIIESILDMREVVDTDNYDSNNELTDVLIRDNISEPEESKKIEQDTGIKEQQNTSKNAADLGVPFEISESSIARLEDASKYLMLDIGGVLSQFVEQPSNSDLVLSKIDDQYFEVLKDGAKVVEKLNILVEKHSYKIAFHSKQKEAEQIEFLVKLNSACAQIGIKCLQVAGIAVRDSERYSNFYPYNPNIIRNEEFDILIAGYDHEQDGKACVRLALSKLLNISQSTRGQHIILDDAATVITKATEEGWQAYEVGEERTLLQAVDTIFHSTINLNRVFFAFCDSPRHGDLRSQEFRIQQQAKEAIVNLPKGPHSRARVIHNLSN